MSTSNVGDVVLPGFRPRRARRRDILLALLATDFLISILAVGAATLVGFGAVLVPNLVGQATIGSEYMLVTAAIAVAIPAVFTALHLYDIDSPFWGSGEFSGLCSR